jgi:DNA helicase-2/ATP-dependent DNA helicase PcrA
MDKTTAVLARTNAALRIFEQTFAEAGIKYHLVGKSGYWSTPEVRSSLAYLGLVLFPADYLLAAAIRAPFWPSKFLPKTKLCARLKDLQTEGDPSYWHLLTKEPSTLVESKNLGAVQDFVNFVHSLSRYRDLPAPDAVRSVLGVLKVGDYFAEEESSPDNDPLANLSELVKIANKFKTLREFLDYARKVTAASKNKKGVMLSTCHSFKGMEADTVFVVGCQDGIMPHAKATDLDEERAIFFVACSRPRTKLVITYAGPPSPFLKKETNNG